MNVKNIDLVAEDSKSLTLDDTMLVKYDKVQGEGSTGIIKFMNKEQQ